MRIWSACDYTVKTLLPSSRKMFEIHDNLFHDMMTTNGNDDGNNVNNNDGVHVNDDVNNGDVRQDATLPKCKRQWKLVKVHLI